MSQSSDTLRGPKGLALAHQTIDLMGEHGVPPAPQNYEVWLAYRLDGPAELRALIEDRIAKGQPFDDATNAQIYEQFFSNVRISAQMAATGERIANELAEVISALQAAGEQTTAYGATLQKAAVRLDEGVDEKRLREVVLGLATATLEMYEHNRRLNARLQRSTSEVDTMRAALRHVRAESLTDALTGLANRKMFDETLRRRMEEAREANSSLCLLLCDIDHFKRFNDTWGHQTGDQIIRFVAACLQRYSKPEHLVARYGGEEFATIMPNINLAKAKELAEGLRSAIETKKLLRKSTNEDLGCITISIGVAQYRPGESPHSFIDRTDSCLYASKRGGRNRITTDAEHSLEHRKKALAQRAAR